MIRTAVAACFATVIAGSAAAAPLCADLGFAGLLANCNRGEIPDINLKTGEPLTEGPITLESGAYYELEIVSDGSQELALTGPEFFRAIWMDEIVINDLEIRPLAIDSVEFDDEGTIELSFVAIKPGKYYLKVPGTDAAAQRVDITIK